MSKPIKIDVEICGSWGYNFKIKQAELILRKELEPLGHTVDLNFIPSYKSENDYFIYLVTDKGRILIFSNEQADSNEGAIIGTRLSADNIKQVIEKILS